MDSHSEEGQLPPYLLNLLLPNAPQNIERGIRRLLQDDATRILNTIPETAVPDEKIHPLVIAVGLYREEKLTLEEMTAACRKVQGQLKDAVKRIKNQVTAASTTPAVKPETVQDLLNAVNDIVSNAMVLQQKANEPAVADREPDMQLGNTRIWIQ